jgi:hypothetical protein
MDVEYIGDRTDDGRTLHINHPNGCKCNQVQHIIDSGNALYWDRLWQARASGYTNYCPDCRNNTYNGGRSCSRFLA